MSSRILKLATAFAVLMALFWAPVIVEAQPVASSVVKLRVQIAAKCTNQAALFRVQNQGSRWPETGVISVYDLDKDTLVTKRRLRLTQGQQASFRIRNSETAKNLGVFVSPGWFDRPFKYDAKLNCG